MKKIVFLLIFLFAAVPALAFHIGPATPAADHGEVNLGVGTFNHKAQFEAIDFEQTRAYAHLGFGLGLENEPRLEIYLRGGAAVLGDEKDFKDYVEEEGQAFGAVGLKGAFQEGKYFSWGMCLQGAYFGDYKSRELEIRDNWEIELAFPLQERLGPVILYAGPVFYHAQFKMDDVHGFISKEKEDGNAGGFGGVGLELGPIRLEAEAQYRSDLSVGGFMSVHF